MGYRVPPPPDRRVPINHSATQSRITIDNGVISYISIPCYYLWGDIVTRIDMMRIDHFGWPSPDSPDRSFQPFWPCRHKGADLESEGYDSVEIDFIDKPAGLKASGYIDGDIVRIVIDARCNSAVKDDIDVEFAAYITGNALRSVVTKGILHIVSGPFKN